MIPSAYHQLPAAREKPLRHAAAHEHTVSLSFAATKQNPPRTTRPDEGRPLRSAAGAPFRRALLPQSQADAAVWRRQADSSSSSGASQIFGAVEATAHTLWAASS
jgi:hypothetical protein